MMVKVIMDCDPGIDDAVALAVALNNPSIDLKLVTTVAGNVTVDKTTMNACKIVSFFNGKVPVAAGAAQPLIKPFEDAARVHGESGMAGYKFGDQYQSPLQQTAVQVMRDVIMKDGPLTLVATGSYTNVALLLREYPEVKPHIQRIIAMGGSLSGGNMTSAAEFNVFTDPDAAKVMYRSGIPIVMVGLDVTLQALLTNDSLNQLKKTNEAGRMLYGLISHYHDTTGGNGGRPMHDLNTFFYLLHPEAFETKNYWIDIQTAGPAIGATVADIRGAYHNGKVNARVCTWVDANQFNRWLLDQVQQMK